MTPENNAQTPQSNEPQLPTNKSSNVNKKIAVAVAAAATVFAILIGVIIFLLVNDNADPSSSSDPRQSSQSGDEEADENDEDVVEQARVVARLNSNDPNIGVELLEPRRVGNTLVLNYRLVNISDSRIRVSAFNAGVYVERFGDPDRGGIAEPYVVSDADGQKYALARDDQNEPLVSTDVAGPANPNDAITGFTTVSLPPSGSTISVFLGDMSAFTDIKLDY